jgi:phosphoglycolate phosphatase-like HAD superfamily hydrolase
MKILRWAEFLNEEEKKVYVFDFDDTLAKTDDLVGILRLVDGVPVKDIKAQLEEDGVPREEIKKTTPSKKYEGGEMAWVTSRGYRIYLSAVKKEAEDGVEQVGNKSRGNIKLIYDREEEAAGEGVEDLIDFTASAHLDPNRTKAVPHMVSLAKTASKHNEVGVVTARRGETEMISVDGERVEATNKKDIARWLKGKGVDIDADDVYGAADYGKSNFPKLKADIVAREFIDKKQPDSLRFFDDDPKNAAEVGKLDPVGTDIYVYTGEFGEGQPPRKPTIVKRRAERDGYISLE